MQAPLKKTLDKPFDEVHEVSDSNDDSHASPSHSPAPRGGAGKPPGGAAAPTKQQQQRSSFEDDDDASHASGSLDSSLASPPAKAGKKDSRAKDGKKSSVAAAAAAKPGKGGIEAAKAGSSEEEESESDNEADASAAGGGDGAEGGAVRSQAKAYNPADYKHLVVSSEIQGLFEYILRHKATDIDLETKMKPFIPDYIPAVGEIDAFLKVPRPDGEVRKETNLGLTVLDEPAAAQSDPTVLELSLRAVNKQVISRHATVGSIEHADKNHPRVLKWIQSIEEVHRKKPPPIVHYSRGMPDIEQLMQVWPPEFEELLKSKSFALPDMNNLDCDVAAFARMVCAIMDIPVYEGKITESLHVLFTLYSEFQNHAYFQH